MGCVELLELSASPWTTKVNHTRLRSRVLLIVARSRPQSCAGAFGVEAPWRPVPNNTISSRAQRVVGSISPAPVLGPDQCSHIILADGWCVRTWLSAAFVIIVERNTSLFTSLYARLLRTTAHVQSGVGKTDMPKCSFCSVSAIAVL